MSSCIYFDMTCKCSANERKAASCTVDVPRAFARCGPLIRSVSNAKRDAMLLRCHIAMACRGHI